MMCPPGEEACGGACVLVATDKHNCGSCGHDCLGGQCSGGLCAPTTLVDASAVGDPSALCQDTANLYWSITNATPRRFQTTPKAGGAVTTIASGYEIGTNDMVTDGVALYYDDSGTIFSIPVGGGSVTTLATSAIFSTNAAIALSASSIVWSDDYGVYSMQKDGTGQQTLASQSAHYLAADDTYAYWTSQGAQPGEGTIQRAPIAGGAVSTLFSGLSDPTWIGVYGGKLYYWDNGLVWSAPVGGGAQTDLVGNTPFVDPGATVVDASGVYFFVGGSSSTLYHVPLTGGAPKILTGGQDYPGYLLSDATALYWTEDTNIEMLAK